jgi:hypothetical protein
MHCPSCDRARERAEEVVGLAEQLGFPLWLALGKFQRGAVRVGSGDGNAGAEAEAQDAKALLEELGS